METAYYLIVEQHAGDRRLRTLDDYSGTDRLASDAADDEAGEFPGRWVGALELSFDRSGRLTEARSPCLASLASPPRSMPNCSRGPNGT